MKFQFAVLIFGVAVHAQSQSLRATITGGDGNGKCTFEVEVDGAAEIEIRGDQGSIRTLEGRAAQWRRLTCTQPLPNNPGQFQFKGVDGRGQQKLVRDPNSSGGVAVIRIQDSQGGSERYTGDMEWIGGQYNYGGVGNWNTVAAPNGDWNGTISSNDAMQICRSQVMQTRGAESNRVTVRPGTRQQNGESRVMFTLRNSNGNGKGRGNRNRNTTSTNGYCNISPTGQILEFQIEGAPGTGRVSWNQALEACQEEAGRSLGVPAQEIRVQHGRDPGNGSYLVNFQVQDKRQRIRTGTCSVSAAGDIESFLQR